MNQTDVLRPKVSIAWGWLLLVLAGLSSFLPRAVTQSFRTSHTSAGKKAVEKPALQIIAEIHGDMRPLDEIVKGNALVDAAESADTAKVAELLRAGADPNARYVEICRYGCTALMEASFLGREDIVRLLIEAGADVNQERDGHAALHFAVLSNNDAVIRRLVAAGARHDATRLQLTAKMIRAACSGFIMRRGDGFPLYPGYMDLPESTTSIEELLRLGAGIDDADPDGFTPLMFAANLGLLENVKLLIRHGADAARKATDGSTALSLAERPDSNFNRKGRREVVDYLRELHSARTHP